MISFGPSLRYFLYREATDMRMSFDSLSGLVRTHFERDPLSGDVFLFVNRRRTHLKALVWDRSGFVLYYKRLEAGTFELPRSTADGQIDWHQLVLMLEGIEVRHLYRRKRYGRVEAAKKAA